MTNPRLLVIAVLVVATGGYLRVAASTDIVPTARLASLPLVIGDWRGRDDGPLDKDSETVLKADAYTQRTYWRGIVPVSLFVAYYGTQRAGHTMHSPLNCLPGNGWNWVERGRQQMRTDDGLEIEVNRNVARKDNASALVYYWYQSRGRVVASDYRNKLVLMYDALTEHRSDGALVRLVAPVTAGDPRPAVEAETFIRAAHAALTAHLPE